MKLFSNLLLLFCIGILSFGCQKSPSTFEVKTQKTEDGIIRKAFIEEKEVTYITEVPETEYSKRVVFLYKKPIDVDLGDLFCITDCAAIYLTCLKTQSPAACSREYRLCKTGFCGFDDVVVMQ